MQKLIPVFSPAVFLYIEAFLMDLMTPSIEYKLLIVYWPDEISSALIWQM